MQVQAARRDEIFRKIVDTCLSDVQSQRVSHQKHSARYTGVVWPLGTTVQIKKPHLYEKYSGEVISVDKKTGVHRIRIDYINNKDWFVEVMGDLLRPIVFVPKGKR